MKVSVCLLVFNHQDYLAQAIESVVNQKTDFQYELIVGDDHSTDKSRQIIEYYYKKYPSLIKPVYRNKNIGMFDNFYFLWKQANGKYIAILEGDDYWSDSYKLAKQVDLLEKNTELTGCFGKVKIWDQDSGKYIGQIPRDKTRHRVNLEDILTTNIVATCSVMYRRGIVIKWPSRLKQLDMVDYPLHILHLIQGDFGYIEDVLAVYRKHSKGVFSPRSLLTNILALIKAQEILKSYLPEESKLFLKLISRKNYNSAFIEAKNSKKYLIAGYYLLKLKMSQYS